MPDNTQQGALDTIATDELTTQNGVSVSGAGIKVQRVKPGYGAPDDFTDVSVNNGLPIDSSESVMTTVTITSASATTAIDTTGFSWISVQVGVGYTTQTALIMQASNDQVTWFTVALSPLGSTSSGLTTALGVANQLFHGPIPARFIRFQPTGTFTSGSQVLSLYMQSLPSVMPSLGTNTNISAVGSGVFPAIATAPFTLGTSTGQEWQFRATGSATATTTQILAAVAGQMPYLTEIHFAYVGTGNPILTIVAAANALIQTEVVMPTNGSDSRVFRHPWKTMSTVNNILNYTITGTFTGTWYFHVAGFYQSS